MGEGVDSINLFFSYENNRKGKIFYFYLHGKRQPIFLTYRVSTDLVSPRPYPQGSRKKVALVAGPLFLRLPLPKNLELPSVQCVPLNDASFFKNYFHIQNETFSGGLRVWSRGHQVRGNLCKLGKLAIFYHAKNSKKIYFFYCFHK